MSDSGKKSRDPYESGLVTTTPKYKRLPLEARFVAISESRRDGRGLQLIHPRTRCIRRYEVHELIMTDELDAAPGGKVDRCHYLGFAEFAASGVLTHGDKLSVGGLIIGTVAGFDESHFPNHYNIVIKGAKGYTGAELNQQPGDALTFLPWA
jgi:hypothetical protein